MRFYEVLSGVYYLYIFLPLTVPNTSLSYYGDVSRAHISKAGARMRTHRSRLGSGGFTPSARVALADGRTSCSSGDQ